jgi:branched-chain amino acid transport system substrate-binding protein
VAKRERLLAGTQRLFGIARIEEIESPVGFLHAYDLTQILARAIALAGSIEHQAVREALERVENHEGIIKFYPRPFTPERHEALGAEDLLMARYRQDGVIVPDTLEFGFAGR